MQGALFYMATKRRRHRRHRGRALLLLVFAAAALYAGYHCLFRPPEISVPTAEAVDI